MKDTSPSVITGAMLAGKYRIEHVLGEGGMGVVVAATNEALRQRVAIKLLRSGALANAKALGRFEREARAAASLRSNHVARVLDVGKLEDGRPYMVMEYLEGQDLGDVIDRVGEMPVHEAVDYVLQACEAIAEAHAAGIIHRDLKPKNLFLSRTVDGRPLVKVLDFGISKMEDAAEDMSLTRTTEIIGSPSYMSPEQLRASKGVDVRTDIWALGVILFELLTKKLPFQALTADDGRLVGTPAALYFSAYDFSGTTSGVMRRVPRSGGLPCDYGGNTNKRPYGIHADGARIYWTNLGDGAMEPYLNGSIVSCEQNGCCTTPDVMWTGNGEPTAIAGDANAVYFATYTDGAIWKVAKP
jgi:serine/threonine protein kinase